LAQELPFISDEELARQTQAGRLDAFEQLVYRYEDRVHAFVNQFCRNAADTRELTQDTFVRAFQKVDQFDSRRSFAAWLFTIARRKCIDRHRATAPPADEPLPDQGQDTDPSELMARHEDGQNLWQLARERLGENQFRALWLHYAEDMDVAQIAQVLGKTKVHVKVMLFRARQVLARELNPSLTLSHAIPTTSLRPALAAFAHQQSLLPPAK
jgi:RNA polymerase sigma-70 factor, ECF subfamily